jgi:hypothetical protein
MTSRNVNRCLAIGAFIAVMLFIPGAMTSAAPREVAAGASTGASASPPAFSPADLTTALSIGAASQVVFAGDPTITVAFTNTLNSTVSTTVYAIAHSYSGQVVLMTASNLVAAPHTTQTVYLDVAGLLAGSYRVTIFAVSDGVVISSETAVSVTIG